MITVSKYIGSLTKWDGDILHKGSRGIHYVGKTVFRTTQKHLQYDWRLLERTATYGLGPNRKKIKTVLAFGMQNVVEAGEYEFLIEGTFKSGWQSDVNQLGL